MKIAFNRILRRSAWGGGAHFATTLADFLIQKGHKIVHTLEPNIDAILMLDPRWEEGGFDINDINDYKIVNPDVKIIHRINDTDIARGTNFLDKMNIQANSIATDTVFISKWVSDYYVSKGRQKLETDSVILNGCNTDFYYQSDKEREICLMVMSRPRSFVTHHWSDNPAKGLDLYKHIDDIMLNEDNSFSFTYIGRFPKEYVPKSKRFRIIPPLYGKELGDELRKHDVYVTAARYEACGMHHIEGAVCGMPVIFHKDGGGVVEMCQRYGEQIDKIEDFTKALDKIQWEYKKYCDLTRKFDLSAKTMCEQYLYVLLNNTNFKVTC